MNIETKTLENDFFRALQAVIPVKSRAIRFAGGEGEAGALVLQFWATGEEIERLLALGARS